MDYRKKNITELEHKKQETLHSLDLILEDFGRRLMERMAGAGISPEAHLLSADAEEYRRLQNEAADSEGLIKSIEKNSLRLQGIDEDIEQKEGQRAAVLKELSGLYCQTGKLVLENPQHGEAASSFRQQADSLISRVESLETRLVELEANNGANVFSWVGKSARALVTRSQLAKAQNDLAGIYEAAGDEFARSAPGIPASPEDASSGEIPAEQSGLLENVENIKGQARVLEEELAKLREERREINGAFNAAGGPVRHIRDLEKQKNRIKQELTALYRRFGEEAANSAGARTGSAGRKRFASLLHDDDKQTLEKIGVSRKTAEEYDGEIEKLKASLAMDEQKAEILRLEKAVAEQHGRIAAAEDAIAGYKRKIENAKARIEELSAKL
jgi:chromosome segregation ATPase